MKKKVLKVGMVFVSITFIYFIGHLYLPFTDTNIWLRLSCGKPTYIKSDLAFTPPDQKYETCLRRFAITHNDVAICAKQTIPSCFYTIAKNLNDKTICNSIMRGPIKTSCLKAVSLAFKDINLCEPEDRMGCTSAIAQVTDNVELCNTLPDLSYYFWCISSIAVKLQDPNICTKLDGSRAIDNFKPEICVEAATHPQDYESSLSIGYGRELNAEFGIK